MTADRERAVAAVGRENEGGGGTGGGLSNNSISHHNHHHHPHNNDTQPQQQQPGNAPALLDSGDDMEVVVDGGPQHWSPRDTTTHLSSSSVPTATGLACAVANQRVLNRGEGSSPLSHELGSRVGGWGETTKATTADPPSSAVYPAATRWGDHRGDHGSYSPMLSPVESPPPSSSSSESMLSSPALSSSSPSGAVRTHYSNTNHNPARGSSEGGGRLRGDTLLLPMVDASAAAAHMFFPQSVGTGMLRACEQAKVRMSE